MIVSNIYTTIGYFLHERLWARIRWGTEPAKSVG
jgi:adenylylsulfate kinase